MQEDIFAKRRKVIKVFCIIFAVCMFCELFLFNFRFWESLSFSKINDAEYSIPSSFKQTGEGYIGKPDSDAVVIIKNLDKKVKNLYIDFSVDGKTDTKVKLKVVDEGNTTGSSLPERTVVSAVDASKCLRLHPAGKVSSITVTLLSTANANVSIKNIGLNIKAPFVFSIARFLFLLFFGILFYILRPGSFIYQEKLNLNIKWQKIIIITYVILQVIFFWQLVNVNHAFQNPAWQHHKQYFELAEAFKSGHTYLQTEPSEALKTMENPYDYVKRQSSGANYLWDHAYFNGKYYVYFGVVPCLLFYFPYYLITGSHIPTYMVIFIMSIFMTISILLLLMQIIKKWFKETPFGIYLLLSMLFVNCGGLIGMVKRPDFYTVPIIIAITLALFGLYFWLSSIDEEGKIKTWKIMLGSIFMALVAGSRPQMVLSSFFAIVLFWDTVFKKRTLFSKSSVKQSIAFVAPYLIVATGLMWYNFARFGSPFDFGANYNLTFNDMTKRGIVFDRTLLGVFHYFFQPMNLTADFPFLRSCNFSTAYMGTTISEDMFGGSLMLNPILWVCIFVAAFRKYFKDKKAYRIAYLSVIFAVIIAVADTQMAGILTRYLSDYTWLLYLSFVLIYLAVFNNLKIAENKKAVLMFLIVGFAVCLAINYMTVFVEVGETLQKYNPEFFYKMKHLIAFML